MPPRPFPYSFRVGTDICNVSRVQRMLTRDHDGRLFLYKFLKRVLTDPERTYFWDRFGPQITVRSRIDDVSEYLAGRFAAKEAMRKACDHFQNSSRGFHSLIVLPIASCHHQEHQSAAPQGLILDAPHVPQVGIGPYDGQQDIIRKPTGRMFTRMDDLEGQLCPISISHDGDFATAVAVVPYMREEGREAETKWPTKITLSPEQLPQQGLAEWDTVLSDNASPQQLKTSSDAGQMSGQKIEELMRDLQRRNFVLDQIEIFHSMKKKTLEREEKVFAESTPGEKLRWRLFYSKETSLTASHPEDESR